MFCREQVAQLRDSVDAIRHMGGELFAIGSGEAIHAEDFIEQQRVTFPIFVDPDLATFRAARLKRSVAGLIKPSVLKNAVRALASGARQGWRHGDQYQLGGVFIVMPGGKVVYDYISNAAGDHPAPSDVLAALRVHAQPPAECPAHSAAN